MRDLIKNNAKFAGICLALLLAGLLVAGTSLAQAGSNTEELAVSSAGTAGSQGTVLLFEDFSGSTFPPDGWSTVKLEGDGDPFDDWSRDLDFFNSAPGSARNQSNSIFDGFQNDWLVTSSIQLGDNSELTFADRGTAMSNYTGSFVNVSTGSCDPFDFDFVEVAEIDDSPNSGPFREGVTVDLSSFDNQEICIAFIYRGFNGHTWRIDDIRVSSDLGDSIFVDRFEPETFKDCPDCPAMVMIPAGTFTQGSPESEPQSHDRERPQREVNVPAFALGQTEVTFEQWDSCVADGGCSHTPGDQGWGRGNRPVINVSWNDAQEYVDWLSDKTGHDYRLPSESEQEYATRAGTSGRFNTGDCITTDQANFEGFSAAQGCQMGMFRWETLPVASFAPNAFGLYDSHGNAREWVQDCWNSSYTGAPTDGSAWMTGNCDLSPQRGGSWADDGGSLRSAARFGHGRGSRNFDVGFRVARVTTFQDCPDCPTMVMIPAGTFTQGSPESEPESLDRERPQREVNVPAFAMGQTEVTFEQWDTCVADGGCSHTPDDEGWGRGNRPVINVGWNDAQEYVDWLSNKTGHNYRLPSESEREYATRAGTSGRFNTGDCITTDQANFQGTSPAEDCPSGNFREQTLPVASFAPNAFGLHDTHGNVSEWTQDCWNEDYNGAPTDGSAWKTGNCIVAVLRGGSWISSGRLVRSAHRLWDSRGPRRYNNGFRVARSVDL